MNTKEKLTLGIAAIFMITLAIVGVTYAYFVTRITYSESASTTIKTANIIVTYGDGNGEVALTDVEPGVVTYKGFTVKNESDIAAPYAVVLTSTVDMNEGVITHPEFVHTIDAETKDFAGVPTILEKRGNSESELLSANLIDECYDAEALDNLLGITDALNSTTKPNCYDGNRYNNIYATLYEISYGDDSKTVEENETAFNSLTSEELARMTEGVEPIQSEVNAPANSSADITSSPKIYFGEKLQKIDAKDENTGDPAYKYYILKIEYKDIHKNQNIENEAVAKFKVDITGSTGQISNETE